jgi:HEAT repeat protein
MPAALQPYALVRRIIVAVMTGSLPDEYREDAAGILLDALHSDDDDMRAMAIVGLNELGETSGRVVPALIDALKDSSEHVRKRATRTLGDFGDGAADSLPALIEALDDAKGSVRLEAMASLGRLGAKAARAIQYLIPLLGHDDSRVRSIAGSTLKKIGPACVPHLLDAIHDPDAIVRERAAYLLGKFKPEEDEVVQALLEACSDFDFDVRRAARGALELLAI